LFDVAGLGPKASHQETSGRFLLQQQLHYLFAVKMTPRDLSSE